MRSVLLLPLWALVAFVLYKFTLSTIKKRRHAALAKSLGCKPAPALPSADPLGISNLRRLKKSDSEGWLPEYLIERVETVSKVECKPCHTFTYNLLGQTVYFTSDP